MRLLLISAPRQTWAETFASSNCMHLVGVIPIWAVFFIWHILSPIETFAKVEAMSESRSIEDLPIIICCSFRWIPVFT